MSDFIYTPFELLKGKAVPVGTVTTYSNGEKWKKLQSGKWTRVIDDSKSEQHTNYINKTAQRHFDYAMTSSMGHIIDNALKVNGVDSFESLVDSIKKGDQALSSRIYKTAVDSMREAKAEKGVKKATLDNFGRALIMLRGEYGNSVKARLTMDVKSKSGKVYRAKPKSGNTDLPQLKATVILKEKKKMGGWSVTGNLTSGMVSKMIKNKTATLVSGKINAKKKWVMPSKAVDLDMSYTGKHLGITVKQVSKVKKRNKVTAKVFIKVPYAFAKAFLLSHITSVRTRNNIIFRMENSKGYRNYIEKGSS